MHRFQSLVTSGLLLEPDDLRLLLIYYIKEGGFVGHEHDYQRKIHEIIDEAEKFLKDNKIEFIEKRKF